MTNTFAFTVHPRARLGEDLARVWSPLARVPDSVYDTALRRLPLPPVNMAGIHIGGEHVGHVVLVPYGARHLWSHPARDAPAFTVRSTRPGLSAATSWGSAL